MKVTKPEIGSIWKEVDPRFERKIKVVGYCEDDPGKVLVQTVGNSRRATRASIQRFNGKRCGYELIKK